MGALLAIFLGFWIVPLALAAVQLHGLRWREVPRRLLVGVAVLYVVVIPVLGLSFAFALLVFDCHGGYECPF
jgi:Flp pilus assembly protein protease CpaA